MWSSSSDVPFAAEVETRKKLAIERLNKDLQEVLSYPLVNAVALPTEKNVFFWHVNCKGIVGSKLQFCLFHLILEIPSNYPQQEPKIRGIGCPTFVKHVRFIVVSFHFVSEYHFLNVLDSFVMSIHCCCCLFDS